MNYYSGRHRKARKQIRESNKFRLPKLKKILYLLLALFAAVFLIIWFMLGPFRFLLFKYPALSGFPFGNRQYIVLFQNNYELRPTGGFISTFGVLRFKHGLYAGIEFYDVYGEIDDHEYVEPPLVLATLLEDKNYQGYSFRDANYNPDFPLAKEDLIRFYNLIYPDEKIDGVLAADFSFLESFVGLYEPLYVEGYELTERNLFETLSAIVSDIDRRDEKALANRKNITSPLVKQLLFKSIMPWRISKVIDLAEKAFEEKHLLATFQRKRLEKAFDKRAWNGALPKSGYGDFLAVNDANYGGMKSNRYITRDVKYELEVGENKDILGNPVITATVTIRLSHEGIWNIPLSGAYTGYLRTILPVGSDIINGSDIIEETESALIIGELVSLKPGEEATYSYSYELPEYVWQGDEYRLHLHKQPGTDADSYEVVVRVPQGMSLETEGMTVRENLAFYETDLRSDQNLSFSLVEDKTSPRIVLHEITAPNEITIVFNEPISPNYASDPLLYQITDKNVANADITDSITIDSIQVDGNAVIIRTKGMKFQPNERYKVLLKEIRDTKGNIINPSPRSVTVVQEDIDFFEEPLDEEQKSSDTEGTLAPDPDISNDG